MAQVLNLYHGSSHVIERPSFGAGKPYNDYGQGFYCTESRELACEWASAADRDGVVNAYSIDLAGLDVLDLQDPGYTVLHWLAVLLQNRTFDVSSALAHEGKDYLLTRFLPDYQGRDIICGYRADDSYFAFAQDFLNGQISVGTLGRAMRLGKLGEQAVIKSERAFERLRFEGADDVESSVWYARRMLRDGAARREYFDAERHAKRRPGDLYMIQILDEEVGPDDPRIR